MYYIIIYFTDSLISSQLRENGIRYPQSTESGHFPHVSQPQGITYLMY